MITSMSYELVVGEVKISVAHRHGDLQELVVEHVSGYLVPVQKQEVVYVSACHRPRMRATPSA